MGTLKCCVGGCNATSQTHRLFCFPKNDGLRKLWLSFLVPTNPLLIGLSKEQLFKKRVCVKHFDKHQFDYDGRRLRYSYPCLLTDKEIAQGVPLSSAGERDSTHDHNYFKQQDEEAADTLPCIEKTDGHNYFKNPVEVDTNITTLTVMRESADVMLTEPSCSGLNTESESENEEADITPTQNSSKHRKFGSKSKKFIDQITQMATERSSHTTTKILNEMLSIDMGFLEKYNFLNTQAKTFLLMQLKQVQKSNMARRFTLDEKLLALLLLKQSPKGYRLLEKMFALPNKKTLIRLSEKVSMDPGLNPKIFENIKRKCENWDTKRKLCTIVFDEVALTPHFTFQEKFGGLAEERKLGYGDHALVFMLRGICLPWLQSVAYYFCEGTVSAAELQKILKQIVPRILLTGLIPLGIVCDQRSTFRTVIRKLREDTIKSRNEQDVHDDGFIDINGHEMSVFYDPPRLLKGIRNNFMSKDIIWNGKQASWKDIEFVFDIDSKLGDTKALPKLTVHHVDPKKMKKKEVSVAAQVLSAQMAAMLKFTNAVCQLHSADSQPTMVTTAEVVEFFDNLFDSVNGYPGGANSGKLRQAVEVDSPHNLFWSDAINKLKSLYFLDNCSEHALRSGKPRAVKVPSLQSWITTLESFQRISKILFNDYGVDYYYPRHINKDPLEKCFGRIRALNAECLNLS